MTDLRAALPAALFLLAATPSRPLPSSLNGWERKTDLARRISLQGEKVRLSPQCLNGDDYFYWQRVGVGEDRDKLLIFLRAGGSCAGAQCAEWWRDDPHQTIGRMTPDSDGIFDEDDDANPYQGWSKVWLGYCSGDAHSGRSDVTEEGWTHRGFDNVAASLAKVSGDISPSEVVLAGASAGGQGAWLHSALIPQLFPDASSTATLVNAALGVVTQEVMAENYAEWNLAETTEVLGLDLGAPEPQDGSASGLTSWTYQLQDAVISGGPDTAFAYIGYDFDQNQSRLGTVELFEPVVFHDAGRERLEVLEEQDNVRFYVMDGNLHTILAGAGIYCDKGPAAAAGCADDAPERDSLFTPASWLTDWQADPAGTESRACGTCLLSTEELLGISE